MAKKITNKAEGKDIVQSKDNKNEAKNLFLTKKYIFIILLILLLFLGFNILKPYFVVIIMSMILTYVMYPLYKFFNRHIKNENICAGITLFSMIILILIPIAIIGSIFYFEATDTIDYIKENKDKINTVFNCFSYEDISLVDTDVCNKIDDFQKKYEFLDVDDFIASSMKGLGDYISLKKSSLIKGLASVIIQVFMMIFIIFFLLRDGKKLFEKIKSVLNMKKDHEKTIIKNLNDTTFAVIYGVLLVALIQGVVAGLGAYFIAGMSQGILIGALVAFFALIPFLGSGVIWVPVSLFIIMNGILYGDNVMIIRGVGFFIWGAFVVSLIDNILRPKIIGDRANIHPLVVFFGIFGGIKLFGLFGIIIGPIVLSLLVTFIRLYELEIVRK